MRLNDFNKKLKQEYNETFETEEFKVIEKKKRKYNFRFKIAILAVLGIFICFLFIQHIGINIYNSNGIKKAEEAIASESNKLYKIESTSDFEKKLKVRSFSKKKSILSSIFSIQLTGCTSYKGSLDGAPENNNILNSYDTNVQTIGVDESDTAKCDGNYIYSILECIPYVASLDQSVFIIGEFKANEMYVYNDKLVYLTNTGIKICRIENEELVIIQTIHYDYLVDSRLVDNVLYFVSRVIISNEDLNGFYYDGTKNANALFSISSFNLDTFEKNSIEVITSYNATLSASNNNFYLASTNSFNSLNKTYITIVDMQLNEVGVIRVDGHILNQFSMDEYNGYLRVVTINTLKNDYELNALYIYSLKSLEMVGSITRGIGIERQTIKSTTFAGDVCYAVTYLNKDPLYEIDCSDPTNPYIVSQYEAPGYSSYLKTFEINEKLYTIGTGYDDSFNVKMSVYEQTKDGTFQIGRDLIFSTYRYSNDTELLYYNADYPYNLLNHKALFIYCDDTHIFVGAMVERNLYTIFKVDVTNYSRPISTYLEISVVTDYEAARGFLVDGKFYIPTTNGLNITEWK